MRDLAFVNGDVVFDETSNLVFVEDEALVAQRVEERLDEQLGEWSFDITQGLDYLGQIFVKAPNLEVVRALILDVVLGVPEVSTALVRLDTTEERTLLVSLDISTTHGDVKVRGVETDEGFAWRQL
jgi:hypothetical protein